MVDKAGTTCGCVAVPVDVVAIQNQTRCIALDVHAVVLIAEVDPLASKVEPNAECVVVVSQSKQVLGNKGSTPRGLIVEEKFGVVGQVVLDECGTDVVE